jgi:RimJ/RimL family protein N-acetyltransferase
MTRTPAPAPYRLRPITDRDRADLSRFYAGLSPSSRAARFHGATSTIADATATLFCGPDHEHREGIVAESVDGDGRPVIIGHVCIEPIDDEAAEMAIAVADAWQRRGVGRAMLAEAIDWAQRHDIRRLVASMQWGNTAVLALVRSMGYPVTFGGSDVSTIEAYLDVHHRSRPVAA